jgi:hypothetical protein
MRPGEIRPTPSVDDVLADLWCVVTWSDRDPEGRRLADEKKARGATAQELGAFVASRMVP